MAVVAQLAPDFAQRNTKVMGVSVDSVEDHQRWKSDICKFAGVSAEFPIIDDSSLNVAKLYDMLPAEAYLPDGHTASDDGSAAPVRSTVRTVFIIGPEKKVRLTLSYPMSIGRNFAEIIRCLDAIRATDSAPIVTPANWAPGEDVIISPRLSNEDAKDRFGEIDFRLPYVRFVKAPPRS